MKFSGPFLMASALIASLVGAALPSALAARPTAKPSPSQSGYSLTFVDADVRRVLDAILGEMLGVDYSVDPAIQGNITLRTAQPVARDRLVPLLESALKPLDAVILFDGHGYRVLPLAKARAQASMPASLPTNSEGERTPSTPGFATEVISLKHGSATEIGRLLTQFLGKDAVGGTDPSLNQVIISGTGEERDAARKLIARFDVDTLADMNFQMYRLDNVDANSLLAEMERIFKPPFDIIGSRVRIIPLPRLRSVLAIAADRSDLARIEPWIRRLDVGVSGKRKLYSYAVQNGRARDLASALQRVLGLAGNESGGTSDNDQGTNTRERSGSSSPARTIGSGGASNSSLGIGQSAPSTRDSGSGSGQSNSSEQNHNARIVPNETTNALLIYADGEEYDFIKEAIEKLDQPVAQVLIEATLAEVTLGEDLRYGVNFRGLSGITTISNSASGSGVPAAVFPGLSVSVIGTSASAVLNTLQSKTNVRVLSAPKIMVLNNQTATLQVGDQVPIVTQQQQSVASPGAPIVNTIELKDTGVILKVTPRVNESGLVTLDIDQEVSDVAQTTTSGINSPTIQQRRLSSTVATKNGQMVALGGLIRDRTTRSRSGVPFLSQIPVIGGVFGSHAAGGSRTELIILLTPTVLRSVDEVKGVVDALIDGLDAARPLVDRAKARQVGGHKQP